MDKRIIKFKEFSVRDENGYLVPIESADTVPFDIKRIYYIYGVQPGEHRGFHAHKKLYQVLICLNGSVDILLDDGVDKEVVHLNEPASGLMVGPGIWREMFHFSEGSVLLVLASEHYDETDYIRDYGQFLTWRKAEAL